MILLQCAKHRKIHGVINPFFVRESHLGFRRVHIDIDNARRYPKHQHACRIFAGHNQRFIGFLNRGDQCKRAHRSAVDKKELMCAVRACKQRLHDIAFHGNSAVFLLLISDRQQIARKVLAEDCIDRRKQLAVTGRDEFGLILADQPERNLRMRKRNLLKDIRRGISLRGILFQKACAHRYIIKQIAHNNGCPLGAAALLKGGLFAAIQRIMRTVFSTLLPRQNLHARYGTDRRERLAAESERENRFEILRGLNLAGRMAQKRRFHLLRRNAAAVVGHAQIKHAAALEFCGNALCTCVNGVFGQLLEH